MDPSQNPQSLGPLHPHSHSQLQSSSRPQLPSNIHPQQHLHPLTLTPSSSQLPVQQLQQLHPPLPLQHQRQRSFPHPAHPLHPPPIITAPLQHPHLQQQQQQQQQQHSPSNPLSPLSHQQQPKAMHFPMVVSPMMVNSLSSPSSPSFVMVKTEDGGLQPPNLEYFMYPPLDLQSSCAQQDSPQTPPSHILPSQRSPQELSQNHHQNHHQNHQRIMSYTGVSLMRQQPYPSFHHQSQQHQQQQQHSLMYDSTPSTPVRSNSVSLPISMALPAASSIAAAVMTAPHGSNAALSTAMYTSGLNAPSTPLPKDISPSPATTVVASFQHQRHASSHQPISPPLHASAPSMTAMPTATATRGSSFHPASPMPKRRRTNSGSQSRLPPSQSQSQSVILASQMSPIPIDTSTAAGLAMAEMSGAHYSSPHHILVESPPLVSTSPTNLALPLPMPIGSPVSPVATVALSARPTRRSSSLLTRPSISSGPRVETLRPVSRSSIIASSANAPPMISTSAAVMGVVPIAVSTASYASITAASDQLMATTGMTSTTTIGGVVESPGGSGFGAPMSRRTANKRSFSALEEATTVAMVASSGHSALSSAASSPPLSNSSSYYPLGSHHHHASHGYHASPNSHVQPAHAHTHAHTHAHAHLHAHAHQALHHPHAHAHAYPPHNTAASVAALSVSSGSIAYAHLPGHTGNITHPRRAAQNRAAQRTFRNRRKAYIKEMEHKVTELDMTRTTIDAVLAENKEIWRRYRALEATVRDHGLTLPESLETELKPYIESEEGLAAAAEIAASTKAASEIAQSVAMGGQSGSSTAKSYTDPSTLATAVPAMNAADSHQAPTLQSDESDELDEEEDHDDPDYAPNVMHSKADSRRAHP